MKAKPLDKMISELRTDPTRPGAEDIEAMANRVTALELLYHAAQRHLPSNTYHGCYSGLWADLPRTGG